MPSDRARADSDVTTPYSPTNSAMNSTPQRSTDAIHAESGAVLSSEIPNVTTVIARSMTTTQSRNLNQRIRMRSITLTILSTLATAAALSASSSSPPFCILKRIR